MSLTGLNAYQQGGPILDKLKQLWGGIRGRADDPSLGYIGASMLPGVGEATDLVEIGAGLQDRSPGRIGLGLAGLMIPFVGAAGLKKIGKKAGDKYFTPFENIRKDLPMWESARLKRVNEMGFNRSAYHGTMREIEPHHNVRDSDWITLEPSHSGALGPGVYMGGPDIASNYTDLGISPRVYPVKIRNKKLLEFDPEGYDDSIRYGHHDLYLRTNTGGKYAPIHEQAIKNIEEGLYKDLPYHEERIFAHAVADAAKEAGYEGLYKGDLGPLRGPTPEKTIINIFESKNIRSPFAAFDPEKRHVADLLAGIGGLASARYMSNALREDREN